MNSAASNAPTLELEYDLAQQGYDVILGCDEVGRGALAGPVSVGMAALWSRNLDTSVLPDSLNDSKKLTARTRGRMIEPIRNFCDALVIGSCTNEEIDSWGISQALGIAAIRALCRIESILQLTTNDIDTADIPDNCCVDMAAHGDCGTAYRGAARIAIILDGPYDYISKQYSTYDACNLALCADVVPVVKADARCALVAAAAVAAKVWRDKYMMDCAQQYPQYACYGWDSNKGYGSAHHRQAIMRYGVSSLHRTSWNLVPEPPRRKSI